MRLYAEAVQVLQNSNFYWRNSRAVRQFCVSFVVDFFEEQTMQFKMQYNNACYVQIN